MLLIAKWLAAAMQLATIFVPQNVKESMKMLRGKQNGE